MLDFPKVTLGRHVVGAGGEASVTIDDIATKVALWDALARVTSAHLWVMVNGRSEETGDYDYLYITLNGDTGNNYNREYVLGADAAASAGRSEALLKLTSFLIPGDGYASASGGGICLFVDAFNTSHHKHWYSIAACNEESIRASILRWADVSAITSIDIIAGNEDIAENTIITWGVVDERYSIFSEVLSGNGDFTISDIPQNEGNLVLIGSLRNTIAGLNASINIDINGDATGANYNRQYLAGNDAVISAATAASQFMGRVIADNATANAFSPLLIQFYQLLNQNQLTYTSLSGMHDSGTPNGQIFLINGRRANTEPVNKLYVRCDVNTFKTGSGLWAYRVPKRVIERIELTEDTATVTFSNIPQNFEALQLTVYARTDIAGLNDAALININNDGVAANYNNQNLYGSAAAVTAARNIASIPGLGIPGNNEGAGEFGGGIYLMPGYSATDRHKSFMGMSGRQENSVFIHSPRWLNTAAITTLTVYPTGGPNFVAGSVFELEGILKKEGLPPNEGMEMS